MSYVYDAKMNFKMKISHLHLQPLQDFFLQPTLWVLTLLGWTNGQSVYGRKIFSHSSVALAVFAARSCGCCAALNKALC